MNKYFTVNQKTYSAAKQFFLGKSNIFSATNVIWSTKLMTHYFYFSESNIHRANNAVQIIKPLTLMNFLLMNHIQCRTV